MRRLSHCARAVAAARIQPSVSRGARPGTCQTDGAVHPPPLAQAAGFKLFVLRSSRRAGQAPRQQQLQRRPQQLRHGLRRSQAFTPGFCIRDPAAGVGADTQPARQRLMSLPSPLMRLEGGLADGSTEDAVRVPVRADATTIAARTVDVRVALCAKPRTCPSASSSNRHR
jgi:hypothetical protein